MKPTCFHMNRKGLIIGLSALGVLLVVISFALYRLYSGPLESEDKVGKESIVRQYKLVPAVPSDAAVIFFSDNLKDVLSELNDSSLVLRGLFTDTGQNDFSRFISEARKLQNDGKLRSLANRSSILSMHYNGNLVPLLVVDAGSPNHPADAVEILAAAADSAGLHSSLLSCSDLVKSDSPLSNSSILLISSSEAVMLSSKRHLENGNSIMDADGFPEAVADLRGEDAIVLSHSYAGKLLKAYCTRKMVLKSSFFRSFAQWTVLVPVDFSSRAFEMYGTAYCGTSTAYFANVFSHVPAGESTVTRILPASTVSALSISFQNGNQYIEAFRNYLDAKEKLASVRQRNEVFKSENGLTAEKWTELLDIREVAIASFRKGNGTKPVLLARCRKENQDVLLKGLDCPMRQVKSSVQKNAYPGYLSVAFGKAFSLEDESAFTVLGDWIVSGKAEDVEEFVNLNQQGKKLEDNLAEALLSEKIGNTNRNLFAYVAFSDDRDAVKEYFSPSMQKVLDRTMNGVSYFPITLSMTGKEGARLQIRYASARREKPVTGVENQILVDTVVLVSKGPFKVKNFSSGKMNNLVQNSNLTITLKDENANSKWTIPFAKQICGRVETIDYYGNGKLQFLFGAGSSYYLLDRLGRFVKPFPVNLGKEILLGPQAYDFTGAHGYTTMVLFKDNTVEMFNLHGERPKDWKGIKDKDRILKLPELLEVDGRSYWVVRTSRQTLVYPFYGGEPVIRNEGARILRPDTEIQVKGNSISGVGLDGRKHTIKLK